MGKKSDFLVGDIHKGLASYIYLTQVHNITSAQRRGRFIHLNRSCSIWSKYVIGWVHWKCKRVCKLISKELWEAEYLQSYRIMQQLLFLDMQILSFILELATIIEIRCPWGASYNATAHNKAFSPQVNESLLYHSPLHIPRHRGFQLSGTVLPPLMHLRDQTKMHSETAGMRLSVDHTGNVWAHFFFIDVWAH